MEYLMWAVIGIISGLISHLLFSNNKVAKNILFFVLLMGLNAIAYKYVLPKIERMNYSRPEMEKEIQKEIPFFKTLKEHDPQVYKEMLTKFEDIYVNQKEGTEYNRIIKSMRVQTIKLIKKKLPRASDETISLYSKVIKREIDELQKISGEACYDLLIAGKVESGGKSPHQLFSKEVIKMEFNALNLTIKTYDSNKPIPKQSEIKELLANIQSKLITKYGADVSLLANNKNLDKAGKTKACMIFKNFFANILELKKKDSILLLRFIVSNF